MPCPLDGAFAEVLLCHLESFPHSFQALKLANYTLLKVQIYPKIPRGLDRCFLSLIVAPTFLPKDPKLHP